MHIFYLEVAFELIFIERVQFLKFESHVEIEIYLYSQTRLDFHQVWAQLWAFVSLCRTPLIHSC